MRTLNLGIVAHVDAGKTSLTERLLYEVGVLDEPGSVLAGTTQTDTMVLERRRGITIRAAVASFVTRGVTVNLLDTPGHSDFIAEVERSLAVLDGAVLVVSAVEGVQAQTVVLFRALQRLRIPTVVFVNKIDRRGARPSHVVGQLRARLAPASVTLQDVVGAGTRAATVVARDPHAARWHDEVEEVVAARDDEVLDAATGGPQRITDDDLMARLVRQFREGAATPVLFGSAITGAGVDELLDALIRFLPVVDTDDSGEARGVVFKVERGSAAEKLVYVHLAGGTIRTRDHLDLGHGRPEKVTAITVFADGTHAVADCLRAGQIGRLRGLESARVGDRIGPAPAGVRPRHEFARPSLETVISAIDEADRIRLYQGLQQLAEQDPLIDVRQDDARGELSVSLYGEVQKEVLAGLLESEYDVRVEFRRSTPLCVEQVVGSGHCVEQLGWRSNPFLAGVGLRVDPAPVGSGVRFGLEVERGSMPAAFFTAVQDTVAATVEQGPHGWQILDCVVTMTHSGYWARQSLGHAAFTKSISSTAADFRYLSRLVLMTALQQAGTVVCEPLHRFELELPTESQQVALAVLPTHRAVPLATTSRHGGLLIEGTIPAAQVHDLHQQVPDLTRGEGNLTTSFDCYQPIAGRPPTRPRTDDDPTHRDAYLRTTARRVGRTWPPTRPNRNPW
ncbi:translation factor GTPase family protein [Angustibacter luteus]|uniref:GTP-binding protein n=1 Tax=Angustibacter luteus TaxID=658456 RepID=A0ABW1JEF2_9ACTN